MAQSNNYYDTTETVSEDAAVSAPESEDNLLPNEAAYESVLPEILAVSDAELSSVNIDVMAAITTVTGALPEIRALRPQIEVEWRNFNLTQFDKLDQYTRALNHAHTRYLSTFTKEDLTDLVGELSQLRDDMLANANSLARMRLINEDRLRNVKAVAGYRGLISDVQTLSTVFKEEWATVAGKTPFTPAELRRAANLAQDLVSKLGLREQAPVVVGEATAIRHRAFTLFLRAYENARRAVHYLRANERDGERIAPSLYAGRTTRRRNEESEAEITPPPPASGPEAAAPAHAPPSAGPVPAPAPPIVINNAAGFPIDNPFTN